MRLPEIKQFYRNNSYVLYVLATIFFYCSIFFFPQTRNGLETFTGKLIEERIKSRFTLKLSNDDERDSYHIDTIKDAKNNLSYQCNEFVKENYLYLDYLIKYKMDSYLKNRDEYIEKPKEIVNDFRKNETVTDIDGNVYHTVKIGTQVWMVENLKVTHYLDGTPIPYVEDDEEWSLLTKGAYCLYQNNPSTYKETYGALYNFYAVSDRRGLCPEGWHVPTAAEWRELIDYLGGDIEAGSKMKDISSNLWKCPNTGASNESGFSGLPAGGRGRLGSVSEVGYYATWWSSTSYDSIYAWHWGLYPDKNNIRSNPGHKASGFSVRCIKD